MTWIGFDEEGVVRGYGANGKKPGWYPLEKEFENQQEAMQQCKELEEYLSENVRNIELARVDINYDVGYSRAVKVIEALLYTNTDISEEDCAMCSMYAQKEGISFEDAVKKIITQYKVSALQETDRTSKKSDIRKEPNEAIIERSDLGQNR